MIATCLWSPRICLTIAACIERCPDAPNHAPPYSNSRIHRRLPRLYSFGSHERAIGHHAGKFGRIRPATADTDQPMEEYQRPKTNTTAHAERATGESNGLYIRPIVDECCLVIYRERRAQSIYVNPFGKLRRATQGESAHRALSL